MSNGLRIGLNVYVSAWGTYIIPEDLYKKTKWKSILNPSWEEAMPDHFSEVPVDCPENKEFFDWLAKEESTKLDEAVARKSK